MGLQNHYDRVIQMKCRGISNMKIANVLAIDLRSVQTIVRSHRDKIVVKLPELNLAGKTKAADFYDDLQFLRNQGIERKYIKKLLPELNDNQISHMTKCLEETGMISPTRSHNTIKGVKKGSISEALVGLTPDQTTWLQEQVPPNTTLAEFFRSLLVDAYFEDMEPEKEKVA